MPAIIAIALTVVVAVTLKGAVYGVLELVGALLSVV
jgi:hypothetical protein